MANNVETAIAQQAVDMGSLVVTSPDAIGTGTTGWDFVADAEELVFSRELNRSAGLSYFFNPKDYKGAGHDLASKDFFGRIPEEAYKSGTIQKQVAGFNDVLRSPKLPTLAASIAFNIFSGAISEAIDINWDTERCLIIGNTCYNNSLGVDEEIIDIGGGVCRDIWVLNNSFDGGGKTYDVVYLKGDTQRVLVQGNKVFNGKLSNPGSCVKGYIAIRIY